MTANSKNKTSDLTNQLKCPVGSEGKKLGFLMNHSNKDMIDNGIEAIQLNKRNRILEIGPGNGAHLHSILEKDPGIRYFGLDISNAMIEEATRINENFIKDRKALFEEYDGEKIPFVHNFFDRILTVNTIYFWNNPELFLRELFRVLKPNGICVISFVHAATMKDLPFVNDSFECYDIPKIVQLITKTAFRHLNITKKTEQIIGKDGNLVDREYIVVTLKKELEIVNTENEIVKKTRSKKMKCYGN